MLMKGVLAVLIKVLAFIRWSNYTPQKCKGGDGWLMLLHLSYDSFSIFHMEERS